MHTNIFFLNIHIFILGNNYNIWYWKIKFISLEFYKTHFPLKSNERNVIKKKKRMH